MMAAQGVEMDRSTLARSAGYAAHLIDPIYNRLRELGRKRNKLHTDDTHIPMLDPGTGKTHKAFLWTYVADDRNSGSTEPPIVWFRFTTGRGGENVEQELGDFRGYLQADGFSGYNRLYAEGIFEVGCYAHWRRKIFDLHEAQPTATTTGFMARIQQIYRIEEEIRGLPAAERLAIRRTRSRPLVKELASRRLTFARCSTRCATLPGRAAAGGCCRTTFRLGRRSTGGSGGSFAGCCSARSTTLR